MKLSRTILAVTIMSATALWLAPTAVHAVTVAAKTKCSCCGGNGKAQCPNFNKCLGTGKVGGSTPQTMFKFTKCTGCNGKGHVKCSCCNGKGKV